MSVDEKLSDEDIKKIENRGRRTQIYKKIGITLSILGAVYYVNVFYYFFKSMNESNAIEQKIAIEIPEYQQIIDRQRNLQENRYFLEELRDKGIYSDDRKKVNEEWMHFKKMSREYCDNNIDAILKIGLKKIDTEMIALNKQAEPYRVAAENIPEIKESRAKIELYEKRAANPFYGLFGFF